MRHFDSSLGGLGGCPFAPGASGNVITEDLVFMFESMGVSTGIDLDKLMAARKLMVDAIPEEPIYGHFALRGRAQRIPCCRLKVCASSSSRTW